MKIMAFRHFDFDDPAVFRTWAQANGHEWTITDPSHGIQAEWIDELDLLIILGGPMSVYEESKYPWLVQEKRFVQSAIAAGKRVLGVCLGAQLLAELLGSRVYPNREKEIGWHKVQRTDQTHKWLSGLPDSFISFQWHGDTFDLPHGAVRLAQSEACDNQAFAYGERVVGLQFHLEATPPGIETMICNWSDELIERPYIQQEGQIMNELHRYEQSKQYLEGILDRIFVQP